ncbi:hypothetical protein HDA40_005399 [Hamadaea flava]|uniref:O-antigen/teichoic acid export membrane protein n=1 Tax=Hamadaea flava TaxID=1742688 RepID=A0ABV8M2T1_9ACTN|nr:hypothetical protein [Hamadaea flava]MCP2326892.1 hypothetical protein [Hamadaea flava]
MTAVLPRPRIVAALLAGRGAYRIATYAGGLALLQLWGPDDFAAYATAVGALAWLTQLVSSGPEKAALNLVPLRGGAGLARFFRALVVSALCLALVAGLLSGAGLYGAAGVVAVGVGSATVLVALYRLSGQPIADSLGFFGLATTHALAVFAAYLGAGPHGVLLLLGAGTLAVNAVLLARLRLSVAPPSRASASDAAAPDSAAGAPASAPPDASAPAAISGTVAPDSTPPETSRTAAFRAVAVLGTADIVGVLGVSVLYLAFAAADRPAETSLFYLLVVVSAAVSTGWGYLLRLAQPTVALRIERAGESAAWSATRRSLIWTIGLGLPTAITVGVLGRSAVWAYVALTIEILLYAANAVSALLLEASGARGRRWSAAASIGQLAAVAGTGGLLVPLAGATGGIAALIAGELARALLMLALTRRSGEPATLPSA